MFIGEVSERLEDRLGRLAKLHVDGHLDDEEYRAAKALVLAPAAGPGSLPGGSLPGGSLPGGSPPAVRTLGQLRWGVGLFIAIVIGFVLACLGSAITTLQRPAGPLLCSRGDFVAGNVSERFGGTTAYNIDSACVTGGVVRHLSQTLIIGVLWVEYTAAAFVVIAMLVLVIRGLRGPPRVDAPADPLSP